MSLLIEEHGLSGKEVEGTNANCLQARERLRGNQTLLHLDLEVPPSRTVRKQMSEDTQLVLWMVSI